MIKCFVWVLISGALIGTAIEFDFPLYIGIPIGLNFVALLYGVGWKVFNGQHTLKERFYGEDRR